MMMPLINFIKNVIINFRKNELNDLNDELNPINLLKSVLKILSSSCIGCNT
jgi:hypothetical protein